MILASEKNSISETVFYITNRHRKPHLKTDDIDMSYLCADNNVKGKNDVFSDLSIGQCILNISPDHNRDFQQKNDSYLDKHFTIVTNKRFINTQSFFQNITDSYANRIENCTQNKNKQKPLLMFIHGAATTFDISIKRLAQIRIDTGIPCIPLAYSWPACKNISSYDKDLKTANIASEHLQNLISLLEKQLPFTCVKLFGHSLGCSIIANALANHTILQESEQFPEVIFAAPDIHSSRFKENLAKSIINNSKRFTIYVNNRDIAFIGAKFTKHKHPRVGAGVDSAMCENLDFDIVDTSKTQDFLKNSHNYIFQRKALDELKLVLQHTPQKRDTLEESRTKKNKLYYTLKK